MIPRLMPPPAKAYFGCSQPGRGGLARLAARCAALVAAAAVMSSCAALEKRAEEKRLEAAREEARVAHATWRAKPGWKSKTYRDEEIISRATKDNISVEISLSEQRGLLLVDTLVAMDFPVATGKSSHPTPPGKFRILSKQKDYSSNLYGKIVDAAGTVLVSNADARTDVPPEGATFSGAKMPYWMRLTDTGVGMHIGYVPGRPASHGCIRLQRGVAQQLFELAKIGTPVEVAAQVPALAGPTTPRR